MARYSGILLNQFERVFRLGTVAGLGEPELLARFVASRDEAAFTALVTRHGPMVLGVCRRLLRDERDVEDAFQATFFVLARRAGAIRDGDRLAGWLHGVARRVARRAQALAARRAARERLGEDLDGHLASSTGPGLDDLRGVLDDELACLPESQRAPLVLCYLQGLTHDEAAARLGWPVGTVRSRMARGRDRLRGRLARRGFTSETAMRAAPVPSALLDTTVKASLHFLTPTITTKSAATAAATTLALGTLHAMTISKSALLGTVALTCALAIVGGPLLARQRGPSEMGDALKKSVEKLQSDLIESARRNAEMQRELQTLKAEVEALRAASSGEALVTGAGTMRGERVTSGPAPGKADARGIGVVPRSQEKAEANQREGGVAGPAMPGGSGGMAGYGGMVGGVMPGYEGRSMAMGRMLGVGGVSPMSGVPSSPQVHELGDWVLVVSANGHRVTMHDQSRNKTRHLDLAEADMGPMVVAPLPAGRTIALVQQGRGIKKTAVFDTQKGRWHALELKAPVEFINPSAGPSNGVVLINVGTHLYAVSPRSWTWDVATLPPGAERGLVARGPLTFQTGGHLFKFDIETGKWRHIDSAKVLDAPEDDSAAATKSP